MNRPCAPRLVLAMTLGSFLAACGETDLGPVDGDAVYAHTAKIVSMSPRPPGSPGIRKVADYIEAELLAATGLELQRQIFDKPELAPGIEYQNLWLEIPGTLAASGVANPPVLVLAAHYDSKITHPGEQDFPFLGALDAGGSCAVLIELARYIAQQKPISPNVWIVFFDGEESIDWEWNDDRALIGSRHFVDTMAADAERFPDGLSKRMRAMVLLDLLGDHNLKIDRDTASNTKLLEIFAKTAADMGRPEVFGAFQSPMIDDHIPFKNRGVKVIDLIDFALRVPDGADRQRFTEEASKYTAWWHTPLDDMSQVSADSLEFVGDLVWNALPAIDAAFYADGADSGSKR